MSRINTIREKAFGKSEGELEGIINSLPKTHAKPEVIELWKQVFEEMYPSGSVAEYTHKPSQIREREELPLDLVVGEKWVNLRKSAHRRGKDFNLTIGDVKKLVLRKTCAYTGVRLTPDNRTVDRIDASKGYVRGNVCAVTHAANQLKNAALENVNSETKLSLKELNKFVNSMNKFLV